MPAGLQPTFTNTTPVVLPNDTGRNSLLPNSLLSLLVFSFMQPLTHLFVLLGRNNRWALVAQAARQIRRLSLVTSFHLTPYAGLFDFLSEVLPGKYWQSPQGHAGSLKILSPPTGVCCDYRPGPPHSLFGTYWPARPAGSWDQEKRASVTSRYSCQNLLKSEAESNFKTKFIESNNICALIIEQSTRYRCWTLTKRFWTIIDLWTTTVGSLILA